MDDESRFDAHTLTEVLRRRLLRSMLPAAKRLARAARGEPEFRNDVELRSCMALARLTAALVRPAEPQPPQAQGDDEDEYFELTPEEYHLQREENARSWADPFKQYGPLDGRFNTLEEAMEYGRIVFDRSEESERARRKQR